MHIRPLIQQGAQNPVRQRLYALAQQGRCAVIERAFATVAQRACEVWSIVGDPPRPDIVTLTPGTEERTVLPPERLETGGACVGVEAWAKVRQHRHRCDAPTVIKVLDVWGRDAHAR